VTVPVNMVTLRERLSGLPNDTKIGVVCQHEDKLRSRKVVAVIYKEADGELLLSSVSADDGAKKEGFIWVHE